ncbi:hypothetical protein ATKI12_3409 [Kitasatospora sp. Ki12]
METFLGAARHEEGSAARGAGGDRKGTGQNVWRAGRGRKNRAARHLRSVLTEKVGSANLEPWDLTAGRRSGRGAGRLVWGWPPVAKPGGLNGRG